jgi:hypothetical protein
MLTLRPAGLSSPAYRDWLDYVIVENRRNVGRLYEDRHSRPELRWFWSITIYVDPKLGITTSGRAATIERAKEQFRQSWEPRACQATVDQRSEARAGRAKAVQPLGYGHPLSSTGSRDGQH